MDKTITNDKACRAAVVGLHEKIVAGIASEEALWDVVIAWQNETFFTASGLPFSYTVRCKKNGEYSGELVVSRKGHSKTLTKSSVLLAFTRVLAQTTIRDDMLVPPEYKGPKAIGQIFGISYIYSLFWRFGLIRVPEKVEKKLQGDKEK
jgi:hypothetical protein